MSRTANQDAFYDGEHAAIVEIFSKGEEEPDWDVLFSRIDTALADPFLPRWYRAKFNAMRAWDMSRAADCIAEARKVLLEMRQVREVEIAYMVQRGSRPAHELRAEVDEEMEPIEGMLAAVERAVNKEHAKADEKQQLADKGKKGGLDDGDSSKKPRGTDTDQHEIT